jgi:hypothetical protein
LIRGPSNSSNLNSKTHTVLRKRSTTDRLDDEQIIVSSEREDESTVRPSNKCLS